MGGSDLSSAHPQKVQIFMKNTLDDWLNEISELSAARKRLDCTKSNEEREQIAEKIGFHLDRLYALLKHI